MIYEKKYLISLLSSAIRGEEPETPERQIDWKKLYELASEQKIAILILQPVCKLQQQFLPPENFLAAWQNESMASAYFFALQADTINQVLKVADEKGIDMLVLKGTVLRGLYPVPELRTMGDCDALIKKEQLGKVKELFEACGYSVERELEKTIEFSKPNALKFELFYEVFTGINKSEGFDPNLWKNAVPFVGEHIVTPSPEDTFVHAIAHLVKHIRHRGAGLRNLADIVLIIEKYELDREYILTKINQLGIYKIFCGIMQSAEKYFGLKHEFDLEKADESAVDALMEYMASNGVYGVVNNLYLYDARNAEGNKGIRVRKYIRRIFPTSEKLSDNYDYAKKHKMLLPIAWGHRLFNGIFKRKVSVKNQIESMKTATDKAKEQTSILEYFNIK